MAQIELRQVTKKFGEAYAVKPVDLTIRDGEFVVLLGPSGCGKTTTLRMISGLELSLIHILGNIEPPITQSPNTQYPIT